MRHVVGKAICGSARIATMIVLLLAGLTALFLVWLSNGMIGEDKWPIQWLEVDGPFQRVSAEQVKAALAPHVSGSYFMVDLEDLREAAERLPWVAEAQARKQWPDTVHIRVLEHLPAARWVDGQLVDRQGELFKVPEADRIRGLPVLRGPQERLDEVLQMWRSVQDILLPLGTDVNELVLELRGSWRLQLSNGMVVRLGREAVTQRLQRFVKTWPSLQSGKNQLPLEVDLRYANGISVRWPDEAA